MFSLLSVVFVIFQKIFFEFNYIYILAIFYKNIEMFFEFQNAYFININKINNAIWINIFRILNTLFLFLLYPLFFYDTNYIIFCFIFLICSNCILLLCSGFKLKKVNFSILVAYTRSNYSYGITSMFMSLNTLIPRYFYIVIGDTKGLGFFTILYLFASTAVNVLQYVFSIKANYIEKIYSTNEKTIKYIIHIVSILMLLLFINLNYFILIFLSFILMFLFMTIRGGLITISIVHDKKFKINISMIYGMVIALIFSYSMFYINNNTFDISSSAFYICLSSWITSIILIYNKKRILN